MDAPFPHHDAGWELHPALGLLNSDVAFYLSGSHSVDLPQGLQGRRTRRWQISTILASIDWERRENFKLVGLCCKKIALVPAVSTSNTTRKAGVCYRGPCVAFPGCTPTQILTETGGRGPHLQLNSSYLFQCGLKYHRTMFISVKFMSLTWL